MMKRFKALSLLLIGGFLVFGSSIAISNEAENVKALTLEYTIFFKDNNSTSDGNTVRTTTADIISSGSSYATVSSASSIYNGKTGYGIKGGGSKSKGSITLSTTQTGGVKPKSIKINACRYGSDSKDLKVSINDGTAVALGLSSNTLDDYEISMDGNTTLFSIKVEASATNSARFYIKSISVYTSSLSPLDTPSNLSFDYSTKTISWDSVENANTYDVVIDSENPISVSTNSYSVSDLEKKEHSFKVRAVPVSSSTTYDVSEYSSLYNFDISARVVSIESINGSLKGIVGLDWDTSNLVVMANLDDGTQSDVSSNCSFKIDKLIGSVAESGTTSVTATYGETTITKKVDNIAYQIIIAHGGESYSDAFTVAEAIEKIKNNSLASSTTYYVRGLYCKTVTAWHSTYKNITVDISDVASENPSSFLRLYRMKSETELSFSTLGEEIVASGTGSIFVEYGTIFELNAGDYCNNKPESLIFDGKTTTYKIGDLFTRPDSIKANYKYTGLTGNLTTGLSYKIGSVTIEPGSSITKAMLGKQTVSIKYTDSKNNEVSNSYEITINYADPVVGDISISEGETFTVDTEHDHQFNAVLGENIDPSTTIIWSVVSNTTEDFEFEDGYFVAGNEAGTVVIRAKINESIYDDCTITINDNARVSLNQTSLVNKYTGDADFLLEATIVNFGENPLISWSSSNDNVATITPTQVDNTKAYVHYLGTGSCTITIAVSNVGKELQTALCNVSVTSSVATITSLVSSVADGNIYKGEKDNSLTLTPIIETIGNATNVINWTVSTENVVVLSSNQTTGNTPITVTGSNEGTVRVTATSDYTSTSFLSFDVVVTEDTVSSISWTGRPTIKCFAGTKLSDAVNSNYGTLTATWASGLKTTPAFGTGVNDFKIMIYDSSKAAYSDPLTPDYEFKMSDNLLTLRASYAGKYTTSSNQIVVVDKLNEINKTSSSTSTGTWSASSKTDPVGVGSGTLTAGGIDFEVSRTGGYQDYSGGGNQYHIIGTKADPTHNLTITSKTLINNISSISFVCGYYSTPTDITVSIGTTTVYSGKTNASSSVSTINIPLSSEINGILSFTFSSTEGRTLFKSFSFVFRNKIDLANVNISAQEAVIGFANEYLNSISAKCTAGIEGSWNDIKEIYNKWISNNAKLSVDEKSYAIEMVKFATAAEYSGGAYVEGSDVLQKFASSYDWIINNYGSSKLGADCDFAGRFGSDVPTGANSIKLFSNTNQNTLIAIISGIAILGAASFGIILMLKRKKKEN